MANIAIQHFDADQTALHAVFQIATAVVLLIPTFSTTSSTDRLLSGLSAKKRLIRSRVLGSIPLVEGEGRIPLRAVKQAIQRMLVNHFDLLHGVDKAHKTLQRCVQALEKNGFNQVVESAAAHGMAAGLHIAGGGDENH
jgi:hypothetical protein